MNGHMLSMGAWNALLKLLEEPPKTAVFIIATTEINKVPDTIKSRCQIFNFSKISLTGIVSRLKYIIEQENTNGENITYEEDALQYIRKD